MVEGSKKILTKDKLTIFLYMLMRDHLPAGVVESIVQDVEKVEDEARLCNGFLAEYAQQLTSRLKDALKIGCIQPKCENYYKKQEKKTLVAKIYNHITPQIIEHQRNGWKIGKHPYQTFNGWAAEIYKSEEDEVPNKNIEELRNSILASFRVPKSFLGCEETEVPNKNIEPPKFRTVSEGGGGSLFGKEKEPNKEYKSTPDNKKTKKIKNRYYANLVNAFDKYEKKGWRIAKMPYKDFGKWYAILEK